MAQAIAAPCLKLQHFVESAEATAVTVDLRSQQDDISAPVAGREGAIAWILTGLAVGQFIGSSACHHRGCR